MRAETDEQARGLVCSIKSLPFPKPTSGKIAVTVVNHHGDEWMQGDGVEAIHPWRPKQETRPLRPQESHPAVPPKPGFRSPPTPFSPNLESVNPAPSRPSPAVPTPTQ